MSGRGSRTCSRSASAIAITCPATPARSSRWGCWGSARSATRRCPGCGRRCPRCARRRVGCQRGGSSAGSRPRSSASSLCRRASTSSWTTRPYCCAWSASGRRRASARAGAGTPRRRSAAAARRCSARDRYWKTAYEVFGLPERQAGKPCPLSFTYQAVRNVAAALALAETRPGAGVRAHLRRGEPVLRRLRGMAGLAGGAAGHPRRRRRSGAVRRGVLAGAVGVGAARPGRRGVGVGEARASQAGLSPRLGPRPSRA